ncbi:MAG: peroxidase family protein [Parasphingopyxis sp.]|uniref:peroxidase family protein n=1 Tax=Parasphingopyxis sp. TaxID=1920299 RepID=UPI003FA07582
MGSFLEDVGIGLLSAVLGKKKTNAFLINRLVKRGRNRPHAWSTRDDYITWPGLKDRSYFGRLLPGTRWPGVTPPALPPPEEVVELFLAGPNGQRLCPKSTCLFPAFAQYLTDGFLRTQLSNVDAEEDRTRTTSNHEIDLSTLYGRTGWQTRALRLLSGDSGRKGRLKSEGIDGEEWPLRLYLPGGEQVDPQFLDAETGRPILDTPLGISHTTPEMRETLFAVGGDRVNAAPQTAMMNVLFLREHNRVAALIEGDHPEWDDDRVFETVRNILIVMFIKLVVEEYINHISTAKFKLRAWPEAAWTADWNRENWMTIEFTLLYRWHSLVPQKTRWAGQDIDGNLLLLNNRVLLDGGLASAFVDISANPATELGLGNAADFMRKAEMDALRQSQVNAVQGYAAYRKAMGRDVPESFVKLVGTSKDPAEQARRKALVGELERLYGSVDRLEFYTGLFAEPREPNGPLPDLLTAMVAMDAFSQALTNPLLSEHVWGDAENQRQTFTERGIAIITETGSLRDILARNATGLDDRFVGMTRPEWRRE